jgi:hypothetical protein
LGNFIENQSSNFQAYLLLSEAIEYLADNSSITLESMNTSKGQKIFNPDVIYSEKGSFLE